MSSATAPAVRPLGTVQYHQILISVTRTVQEREGDAVARGFALVTRERIGKKVREGRLTPEEGLTLLDRLNTTLEQLKLA